MQVLCFFFPLKELEFCNSECCLRELDINKIESFVIFERKIQRQWNRVPLNLWETRKGEWVTKGDGTQTGTRVEESEWDKIVREAFQRNSILLKSSSFFIKKKNYT